MGLRMHYTQPGKLRLYSTGELCKMPPPTWLINGILPAGGFVGMYGQPGSAKSFIATDIACSIGSGRAWHGREVEQGLVLYIAAEGGAGNGKRALAWCNENDVSPANVNVAWIIEPVVVSEDSHQIESLFERIEEVDETPTLVIIDTLARCFEGDENKQEDMGAFVNGVDQLRRELKTTVMVIHHSRLDGDRERGNTAFRGAADAMIQVKRIKQPQNKILVLNDKQKDAEEFKPMAFQLKKRDEEDSCVIADLGGSSQAVEFIEALRDNGVRTGEEYSIAQLEEASGLPRSSFFRGLRNAKNDKLIVKSGNVYVLK